VIGGRVETVRWCVWVWECDLRIMFC